MEDVMEVGETDERTEPLRLMDVLNRVEERIERLRKEASKIEEEKEDILATLDAVRHSECFAELGEQERGLAQHTMDRLLAHCLTVETAVVTQRDPRQEDALQKVNEFIDGLIVHSMSDPMGACDRCRSFVRMCSYDVDAPEGVVTDVVFHSAVVSCALDDRNRIKKRLNGLLNYFARVKFTEL